VTRREFDDFNAPIREDRTGTDEKRVGLLPDSRVKSRLQFAQRADLEENLLSPECVCRGLDFSLDCVGTNTRSILEQRNLRGAGYQL
jgi:hypothetical protein